MQIDRNNAAHMYCLYIIMVMAKYGRKTNVRQKCLPDCIFFKK